MNYAVVANTVDEKLGIGRSENIASLSELKSKTQDNGDGTITIRLEIPKSQGNVLYGVAKNGTNSFIQLKSYEMNSSGGIRDSSGSFSIRHKDNGSNNLLEFTVSKSQVEGARLSFLGKTYRIIPNELGSAVTPPPDKAKPSTVVESSSHSIDKNKTPEQRAAANGALETITQLGTKVGVEAKLTKGEEILLNLNKFEKGFDAKGSFNRPELESMTEMLGRVALDVERSLVTTAEAGIKREIEQKIVGLRNKINGKISLNKPEIVEGESNAADEGMGGGSKPDQTDPRLLSGMADEGMGGGSKPDQTDPRGVRGGTDPREGYRPVSDDPDPRNVKTSQDPRVDSAVTVFATNIAKYNPSNRKEGPTNYSRALEVLNQLKTFDQFERFYTSYTRQTSKSFADAFSKLKDSDKDRLLTQWFGSSTTEYLKEVINQTQTWVWTNEDKVKEVDDRFNANPAQREKYERAWNLRHKSYYGRTLAEQIAQAKDNWW